MAGKEKSSGRVGNCSCISSSRRASSIAFTNTGSAEAGFFDAFLTVPGVQPILMLSESLVVSAADGYAKATNKPAFVNVHLAAGTRQGSGQLQNAYFDGSPTGGHGGVARQRLVRRSQHARGIEWLFRRWGRFRTSPRSVGKSPMPAAIPMATRARLQRSHDHADGAGLSGLFQPGAGCQGRRGNDPSRLRRIGHARESPARCDDCQDA